VAQFRGRTRGTSICDALLEHDIEIEHACEKSCACTTCHVIVREGLASLAPGSDEDEEDMLDMAWGLTAQSRLSCSGAGGRRAAGRRDPQVHHQPRVRRPPGSHATDTS
jgi:ferredoxin